MMHCLSACFHVLTLIAQSRRGAASFSVTLGVLASLGFASFGFASQASAVEWPEITAEERQLTSMAQFPDANAIVLQRRGRLVIEERAVSSYLEVFERVKILDEAGETHGTVSLFANSFYRMRNLEGRTVLPDGRIVELGDDAKFEKSLDLYYRTEVLSFAMPEVRPGAIIDYRYQIFFDSFSFSDPWYFQGRLPVLYNEIVYEIPGVLGFAHLPVVPPGMDITHDSSRGAERSVVTYVGRNLPGVPDEPYRFAFADLAAQVNFLPRQRFFSGRNYPLFDSWRTSRELLEGSSDYGYVGFKRNCGDAKRKAKALAEPYRDDLAKATAIYRFVRDQVATEPYWGVGVGDTGCDDVLEAARGDYSEKALLLHYMLDAAKIDSDLVWARSRRRGRAQPNLTNPFQFDRLLLEVKVAGKTHWLDPGTANLAFGTLSPWLEGIQALRVEKDPEWFEIPLAPASESQRSSVVELAVGPDGVLSGTGQLELTGHQAWDSMAGDRGQDEIVDQWDAWLQDRYPGFDVAGVTAQEDRDARRVAVSWKLTQRAEDVLGDEVLLSVTRPLGLRTNVFSLPSNLRLTPVQLAFTWNDVSEVRITWPEGWTLEALPELKSLKTEAGQLLYQIDGSREERKVSFRREFSVDQTEFIGREAYDHLRRLYDAATTSDAEELVLVAGTAVGAE